MKEHFPISILLTVCIILLQSCLLDSPEVRMEKCLEQYESKKISNASMLFEMGKIFRQHPENPAVRQEYFNKMILSGYASHIIHLFLSQPEKKLTEEDMKTILFALQNGSLYGLADQFTGMFSGDYRNQLNKLAEVNDSVQYYNELVETAQNAEAYEKRGRFFTRLSAADMANLDFDRSIRLNPCNPGAVFEKVLLQFNLENTAEVIRLLDSCSPGLKTEELEWFPVFLNLARELEALKKTNLSENERLFRQANLYINSGFPELALKKSSALLRADGNRNPDYLALQGFIYFKMNNKEQAMQYVSMAEGISGKKSKLSEMVANMK